jgi:hypothetical protein
MQLHAEGAYLHHAGLATKIALFLLAARPRPYYDGRAVLQGGLKKRVGILSDAFGTSRLTYEYIQVLPELLNVYRAGTYATVAVGIGRAFAWLTFIGVETLGLPAVFFAADVSNWMLPLVLVGGPVPMIVTSLATGPMIHDVTIKLPDSARRSKDALKSFVKRLPPDTVVRASYMRWMPWPRSSDMKLRDLRRIQPSWKRGIANLEHLPGSMKGQKKNPFYWFAYTNWGKYYINREQSKDMSASPGVWNTIWNQIPEADSKSELEEIQKAVAGPVAMANRPARHEAKAFAVPLPSVKR